MLNYTFVGLHSLPLHRLTRHVYIRMRVIGQVVVEVQIYHNNHNNNYEHVPPLTDVLE
ncbi:MAG: hypothetical protein HCAMLNBO_02781 [Candidatus Brocadia fulgida]|nr:hypothetical protein [Candidatus Brocadia fulgida]